MEVSESTKDWLKRPSFDSSQFKDEEILLFLQHMFLELELISRFNIRLPILRNFLYEVYKNYNEVPFHNFRHCFCVAQMVSYYKYLNNLYLKAPLCVPSKIGFPFSLSSRVSLFILIRRALYVFLLWIFKGWIFCKGKQVAKIIVGGERGRLNISNIKAKKDIQQRKRKRT